MSVGQESEFAASVQPCEKHYVRGMYKVTDSQE